MQVRLGLMSPLCRLGQHHLPRGPHILPQPGAGRVRGTHKSGWRGNQLRDFRKGSLERPGDSSVSLIQQQSLSTCHVRPPCDAALMGQLPLRGAHLWSQSPQGKSQ